MNARKCDSCGTLYECYYEIRDKANRSVANCIKLVSDSKTGTQTLVEKMDLCPECMRLVLHIIGKFKAGDADG